MLSVLMGILNIWCIFRLSDMFLQDPRWSLFAALFVGTLPQFALDSGMINNDSLANLLSTISIYYAFKILESPAKIRNFVLVGLSLGLGLLTKKTVLFLVPGVFLILCYVSLKNRRMLKQIGKSSLLLLMIIVLVSGWFFIRNYCLYGDLLGTQMEEQTLQHLVDKKQLSSRYFLRPFMPNLYVSFVGKLAHTNLLPKAVYYFHILVISISAIGLFLYVKDKHFRDAKTAFALLFIFLCFGGVVGYNLTYSQSCNASDGIGETPPVN